MICFLKTQQFQSVSMAKPDHRLKAHVLLVPTDLPQASSKRAALECILCMSAPARSWDGILTGSHVPGGKSSSVRSSLRSDCVDVNTFNVWNLVVTLSQWHGVEAVLMLMKQDSCRNTQETKIREAGKCLEAQQVALNFQRIGILKQILKGFKSSSMLKGHILKLSVVCGKVKLSTSVYISTDTSSDKKKQHLFMQSSLVFFFFKAQM